MGKELVSYGAPSLENIWERGGIKSDQDLIFIIMAT